MTYPELECLKLERRGPVGWLINNRPDQLNAMSARMRDEFAVAWTELDRDPEVKVIVHTGEGRAFQTGVDVAEIASDGVGMERYRRSVEEFDLHPAPERFDDHRRGRAPTHDPTGERVDDEAHIGHARANTRSSAAPSPDAPGASLRSAARPQGLAI